MDNRFILARSQPGIIWETFFLNLEHKCHVRDTTIRFYQSLSISEKWKAFFLRSQRTLLTVHYCN